MVEIALEDSIFTGFAMIGDLGIVGYDCTSGGGKGEVVAVYFAMAAVGQKGLPRCGFYLNDVAVVFVFVDKGENALCAAHGDIVFGTVASGYDCNCAFHLCMCFFVFLF